MAVCPNTRVTDIEIQYSEQKIRVGTYGRGVFEADIDIVVCDQNSPDQDGDGICDIFDLCPELDDSLIGTPCDDGDPFSSNEAYSVNCICEGGAANLDYCQAQGSGGTGGDYIVNIQINDLNNSSGKTPYSDFRSMSTNLYEDSSYVLSMTLNFSFPPDTAYAWIDYDRSGSFDSDELIIMSQFNNHISTGTFTVPGLEAYGATTMRVRNIYSNTPVADPCGSYFGEVEDYTIQLREAGPMLIDLDQDGYFSDEDCDDNNPDINPGQTEIPYNGMDDDCDPATLDDDLDQDGFDMAEDCDDENPNVNPNQIEEPYNGIDDDCNPATLDDDLDQDGFDMAEDCDDNNANINPNQTEEPYNGIDDDCDPATLDDDLDQDGFDMAEDCDDNNANINPNATEIPNNGIDEDCDGMDLTTSVHEIANSRISIYPNPANEKINISVSGSLDYMVKLYNMEGRQIKAGRNIELIGVQSIPNGMYLLEISDIKTSNKIVEQIFIDK